MFVRNHKSWPIHDAAAGFKLQGRDDTKMEENDSGFHLPFMAFAVIAVSVVLGLVGMVILRILVLQRRFNTNLPQESVSSVVYNVPTDNPPPIYEHKVSVVSDTNTKLPWNNLQPISVAFDRAVTSYVRLDACRKADASQVERLKAPDASVQTTFLVNLPTPSRTVFPPQLRRRASNVPKKSMETGLNSQMNRQSLEKDDTRDAHDCSKKPPYAPSIRSNMSQKEQGDARREAFFHNMHPSFTSNTSLSHSQPGRTNLSNANQAILNRHDTTSDNDEFIGAIALGSISMQVKEQMEAKDDSCVSLTGDKLSGILHHAKQVRYNSVAKG